MVHQLLKKEPSRHAIRNSPQMVAALVRAISNSERLRSDQRGRRHLAQVVCLWTTSRVLKVNS